jgi:hypothetical protein
MPGFPTLERWSAKKFGGFGRMANYMVLLF